MLHIPRLTAHKDRYMHPKASFGQQRRARPASSMDVANEFESQFQKDKPCDPSKGHPKATPILHVVPVDPITMSATQSAAHNNCLSCTRVLPSNAHAHSSSMVDILFHPFSWHPYMYRIPSSSTNALNDGDRTATENSSIEERSG